MKEPKINYKSMIKEGIFMFLLIILGYTIVRAIFVAILMEAGLWQK
jgi:hypothetical protein